MPFNPFSALTSKIFGGLSIALLIGLAVLWIGTKRLEHKLDDCRTISARVAAERDALIVDGVRRKAAGQAALVEAHKAAAPIVKQFERIRTERVPDGSCDTPASVLEADGL